MKINFTTHIWKERNTYVAFVPELDVSSCGRSVAEAREQVEEAVEGFLDAARAHGSLAEILEEAGFTKASRAIWQAPEIVATERMQLAF